MILSRLAATCRFISATRACPFASAAVMICRVGLPLGVVLREELRRGHEHRAGQAPLTELTPMFQQFMACFRVRLANLSA